MTTDQRRRWAVPALLALLVLLGVGPDGSSYQLPPAGSPDLVTGPVVVHGHAGSFGSLSERLPSGHQLSQQAVPDWQLPAGVQAGGATVAGDGTILFAGRRQHVPDGSVPPEVGGLAVAAYQPASGDYQTVRLATAHPPDASVAGLTALAGGEAVVATVTATGGLDGAPPLAVITVADTDGAVALGDTVVVDGFGGEGDRDGRLGSSVLAAPYGLGPVATLPDSGDLIVARPAGAGGDDGAILAVRVTSRDGSGRYAVTLTGEYRPPPELAGAVILDVQTDPAGVTPAERFAVIYADPDGGHAGILQELRYDSATGGLEPVSAPVRPGDHYGADGPAYGYSAVGYDHLGNLWAARQEGLRGGKLAVYATGGGAQRPDWPDCPPAGEALPGGDESWIRSCPPDYDVLPAKHLPAVVSVVADPAGEAVVAIALSGALMPIKVAASGDGLSFAVGNLVDTAPGLLPVRPGSIVAQQAGAFDGAGRLWFPVGHSQPGEPDPVLHQWLYEVDVAELFAPAPLPLPEVPGQVATVQAGYLVTTATNQSRGEWATVDVNPVAYVRPCGDGASAVGCGYDGISGNGFMLSHHSGLGHLTGAVEYPVAVPVDGDYRVALRMFTFERVTGAKVLLTVGDTTHAVAVDTEGRWRTVPLPEPLTLSGGVHTLRLEPPPGAGGWFLSWVAFQHA